ncbi:hypothetical protein AOQ84DRAFT_384620 [Glonium stellatum]|uniref:C3H1-type domain-containing protein n=1 Tax=Glonium stellatum TaxID=574774 RepID=A0A8E2FCD4_9PEZI|nr:hypothetical protein AOQ84DRAFT_384620 [Glonium stellatum]
MSSKTLRPRWFISRDNGVMVPLVAVDELPEGIRLQGAPRKLTLAEVRGMEFLGEFPPTNTTYSVESYSVHSALPGAAEAPQTKSRFLAPDAMVRKPYSTSTPNNTPVLGTSSPYQLSAPTMEASIANPILAKQQQPSLSVMDAIAGSDPATAARIGYTPRRPLPPSGAEPEQEKKVYCTYWIRTGECDYTQQGCLYKHEMPDLETLKNIGFISEPKWWKEKYAIKLGATSSSTTSRGLTWMQRRMNALHLDDDADGGSDAGSAPRKEEAELRRAKVSLSQPPSRALAAPPESSPRIPSTYSATAIKQGSLAKSSPRQLGDIPVLLPFSSSSSSESSKSDITLASQPSLHAITSQLAIKNQHCEPRISAHSDTLGSPQNSLPGESDLISLQPEKSKEQLPAHPAHYGSIPQEAITFQRFLQDRGWRQRNNSSGNIFAECYTTLQPDLTSPSKPSIPNPAQKYNKYFPQGLVTSQPASLSQKHLVAQASAQKALTPPTTNSSATAFPAQSPTKTSPEDAWGKAQQAKFHETIGDQRHPKQRFSSGLMASVHATSNTIPPSCELPINSSNLNISNNSVHLCSAQVNSTRHQKTHPPNKDGSAAVASIPNSQAVSAIRLEKGIGSKPSAVVGREKAAHGKTIKPQSGVTRFSKRRLQSVATSGAGPVPPLPSDGALS